MNMDFAQDMYLYNQYCIYLQNIAYTNDTTTKYMALGISLGLSKVFYTTDHCDIIVQHNIVLLTLLI